MISPINRFDFLRKNYNYYFGDNAEYNFLNSFFCFIFIPIVFSLTILFFLDSATIEIVLLNIKDFFSILVGFLITSLIFLITFNFDKSNKKFKNNTKGKIDKIIDDFSKLIEKLSYHILTMITFSLVIYLVIAVYPENLFFIINNIKIRYFDFIFLFFLGHSGIIFLNILGLLGKIIKFKFGIDKKI